VVREHGAKPLLASRQNRSPPALGEMRVTFAKAAAAALVVVQGGETTSAQNRLPSFRTRQPLPRPCPRFGLLQQLARMARAMSSGV